MHGQRTGLNAWPAYWLKCAGVLASMPGWYCSLKCQASNWRTGFAGANEELSQCRSSPLGRPDPAHHFGHTLSSREIRQHVVRSYEYLWNLIDSAGVPHWLGSGTLFLQV
jgi:hypothetical protein